METKQIKELMAAMERTRTKRLSISKEGFELTLEREELINQKPYSNDPFFDLSDDSQRETQLWVKTNQALSHATDNPNTQLNHLIPSDVNKEELKGSFVTSPMVGTFYCSPSPDESSFVKIGERVEKNTVICIIEAMKVMNEIKANISGKVVEVLVESGQPVEFGTKLFRIVE